MFRDSNVLRFLPSKKFSIGLIAILLIIGGGAYLFKKPKAGLKYETLKLPSNPSSSFVLKDANKDSDNDGLKDWEEILWKTDPNNPDTDGDGTPDGEEIRQNRDPLKPGPNDKLTAFQPLPPDKEAAIEPQKNILNELTRQLVISYFSQKGQGKKPVVSAQDIVRQVLNQGLEQNLKDVFSENDFNNFYEPTKENKKIYLNQVAKILKNNFEKINETEFNILNRALAKEDAKELENLNVLIAAYKKTVDDLASLMIPKEKDYLDLHLLLINMMNNLEKTAGAMKSLFQDPPRVYFAINWYRREIERWRKFKEDFEALTIKDGIKFGANEGLNLIKNL